MTSFIYVALMGVVGVLCRYGIDQWGHDKNEYFPATTFIINILGCAVAGLIYVLAEKHAWPSQWQTGLLVGFCGGFTTFSAYALQTYSMMEKGRYMPAFLYLSLSPITGFLAIVAMITLARKFA